VLALAGLTALTFVGIAVSNAAFSASTNNTNNTATTTGATTLTVTGLTNGITYYFRVTPITTAGTGTPSAPSTAATP
jgi:serine protease